MLAAVTAAFHQALGPLHTGSITPEETGALAGQRTFVRSPPVQQDWTPTQDIPCERPLLVAASQRGGSLNSLYARGFHTFYSTKQTTEGKDGGQGSLGLSVKPQGSGSRV